MKTNEELATELTEIMFKEGKAFKRNTSNMAWALIQDVVRTIKGAFEFVASPQIALLSEKVSSTAQEEEIIEIAYQSNKELLNGLYKNIMGGKK